MADDDSLSGTGTPDSSDGFVAILVAAFALLRRRPIAAVPFVLAGCLGGASTVARLESAYPVGVAPFPDDGLVHVSVPVVPVLEPVVEIGPAALLGLKSRFFAFLVGWQLSIALLTAVAFAIAVWTLAREPGGIVPPLSRIGWLFAYTVVVQLGVFAVTAAVAVWARGEFGAVLLVFGFVVVPAGVALFLAPAYIVLEGAGPLTASRCSLAATGGRPVSIAGLLLGLGSLGYVLTGVGQIVPSSSLAVAVGTVVSVGIAGTVHAAVVVAAHRDIDRPS
ncbi:hypothetical protein D8Y22_03465 [Salinadaptatus halalkaliphilus]|uniref:Uncharacterized protein n=1 Tax=Salinadaptatus halalkaliphilus TaxID=2419781 RepID=A0A4S3TPP1_9EURY|nr:hypothetical protein [Salinadaptatus halalkaliphilus]THE66339.1 hypothetical protein D8Y22_03465 [Salinadaptatus halalkaliphilus]